MKKILNALKGNGCQARMLTAAMTVLSAMAGLTSCANEDTALDNTTAQTAEGRTVEFTATLAPKGDDGGQTRAITVNDQNTANETLNVAWAEGEQVAVYYQKTDDSYATATATVGTPNGDGSAPITAKLTDAKGGKAKFVYPATLHDGQGDIDESKLQNKQVGKLTEVAYSISNRFDAATGSGTISISDGNATTSGNISLANKCCICKFKINLSGSGFDNFFKIMIAFKGSHTYTILTQRYFLSEFYVAMLPETSADCTITAMGYNDQSYSGNPSVYQKSLISVTLEAGKFYNNVPITLTKLGDANKTLTTATGELTLQDGDIVTGTGGANTHLKIEDGATVTLINLTNTSISHSSATSFAGIECLGDATIILAGVNSVKGVYGKAGIYVPEGKTLTIRGGGKLTATANDGAGIGGNYGASCGNIVIEGGTINATGPGSCAGIGSGKEGSCGTITITGGTIIATGGNNAAGIGSGAKVSCGTITITGGNITATGGNDAAGIGSGKEGSCGNISISGSAQVTATGGTYAAGIGSGNTDQVAVTCGDITISGSAQVTATGGRYAAGIGNGHANQAANTCGDISINGSAKVTATGGSEAAGIGSGWTYQAANTCGAISISGSAQVTATGGTYVAGIGSGNGYNDGSNIYVSSCGAISITGGTIEATGIGSGWYGKFTSISITKDITRVTATRSNKLSKAPIGKGDDDQGSGGITIDGQTISDAMTKGTESLPTFPNLSITITGGSGFANGTWTITRQP